MKLDYLKLINQFWQLRRSKRITSLQADLYYFLIQECNVKYWENPFECSNVLIKASIGISEPSLIDARNRLKQIGLIEFQGGKRNENSPVYQLLYLNNFSRNRVESLVNPLVETEVSDIPIKKQKPNKNQTSKSHSGASPPETEKKEEVTAFWKPMVDIWFKFYKQNYQINPTFKKEQGENLKRILSGLQKIASTAGEEWTEESAGKYFKKFLFKAYRDEWLKNNFLLKNLNSNFDSIATPVNDGTTTTRSTYNQTNRADDLRSRQDLAAELLHENIDKLHDR